MYNKPERYIIGMKIYIPGKTEVEKTVFELTEEQLQHAEVTFSGTDANRPAGADEQELFLCTTKLQNLVGREMKWNR